MRSSKQCRGFLLTGSPGLFAGTHWQADPTFMLAAGAGRGRNGAREFCCGVGRPVSRGATPAALRPVDNWSHVDASDGGCDPRPNALH